MKKCWSLLYVLSLTCLLQAGCATAPADVDARSALEQNAQVVLQRFVATDPTLQPVINRMAGYAVFPSIVKGGAGLGGAYGRGILYINHKPVGYCDVSQGSIGFQLGGQEYSELILFRDQAALNQFKANEFTFAAQASAVAASSGAAANADYTQSVIVFTQTVTGLMAEASVGGQRFTYQPRG